MAQQVDSTDTNALPAVTLEALDDLSRSYKLVEVDNALHTSDNGASNGG
nr:hypothetical protein [Mycobacterium leprae]